MSVEQYWLSPRKKARDQFSYVLGLAPAEKEKADAPDKCALLNGEKNIRSEVSKLDCAEIAPAL